MNAKARVNVNTDQAGPLATVPPASGVVSFTKFGPQRVLNWRAAPVYVWERLWLVSADAACQIAMVSLLHQLQVGVDDPGRFRSYGIRYRYASDGAERFVTALAKQYIPESGSSRQVALYMVWYALRPRYACTIVFRLPLYSAEQFSSLVRFLAAFSMNLVQALVSTRHDLSSTRTVLVSCFLALKNDWEVY